MVSGIRSFRIVFGILIFGHVLLMLWIRLYPFTDVPNHLAAATILRYYGESAPFQQYFFIRPLFGPNVLHLLFCSLKIFPSVELANRIYFVLYVILLPLSTWLVIRKIGGNPWFALLSFLLIYDFCVHSGNVGFIMAVPFMLLLFGFTLDYLQKPTLLNGLQAAAMMVLIFLAHGMATQFALALFVLLCLWNRRNDLRKLPATLWPVVPLAVFNLIWWNLFNESNQGRSIFGFLQGYYRDEFLQTYVQRKVLFNLPNFHLLDGAWGNHVSQAFSLLIIGAALAVSAARWRDLRARFRDPRVAGVLILGAAARGAYLLLPNRVPDCLYVYQRFASLIFLSLILLGSLLQAGTVKPLRNALVVLACLVHLGLWSQYMWAFNREAASFTPELFASLPQDKTVAGLIAQDRFRGWSVYRQFPNYFIIWKKGVATTRIVDYSFGYIRRKVDLDRFPHYSEWEDHNFHYDGRYSHFDYYLTHGVLPDYVTASWGKLPPLKARGPWSVFKAAEARPPDLAEGHDLMGHH